MNKSLKILVISLICIFFIFSTNCFAVNIDMNLSSNLVDEDTTNSYNDESSNSTQTNDTSSATNNTNTTSNSTGTTSSSNRNTSITDTLQALPESELGLTNILNILLIAIGFVLILLGIAIFIKLKH